MSVVSTKVCPKCKAQMTYFRKGISKKGNPYDSFWSCKGCSHTEDPNEEERKKLDAQARRAQLDGEITKFKSMAWFNATNAGIEIAKAMISLGMSKEDALEVVEEVRDKYYRKSLEFFIKNVIEESDE